MTYAEIKEYIIKTTKEGKPLHGQTREWAIDLILDGYITKEDLARV